MIISCRSGSSLVTDLHEFITIRHWVSVVDRWRGFTPVMIYQLFYVSPVVKL